MDSSLVRAGLIGSISGPRRGRAAADLLCAACVEFLDIDGAALAVVNDGTLSQALGSNGPSSRELIEMQFALGEGPCIDVADTGIATTADLTGPDGQRWPALSRAAYGFGVRMMFVLPVAVIGFPMGTLCLHRERVEPFDGASTEHCFLAAELAAMPLLDLIAIDLETPLDDDTSTAWDDMASLSRAEVYQAAGVLMVQLGISPAEALVRLRQYAVKHGRNTSQVAYDILENNLRIDDDQRR